MKRTRSLENDEGNSNQQPQAQETPPLLSLQAPVSPPQRKCRIQEREHESTLDQSTTVQPNKSPDLVAIEAGKIEVTDHLMIYSKSLGKYIRRIPETQRLPRLAMSGWRDLYTRNDKPEGHHFVIHQHDHPLAGPHYDLRLQFSETSSVSWSVMYGLPGDPNSQRPNRNATETRVHSLWSHLNESASSLSGSMIIWDTGEYEVLPYHMTDDKLETDNSQTDSSASTDPRHESISESDKLQQAFHSRKIRLRLHGTRLPKDYTICLRMDKSSNFARNLYEGPKRRRRPVSSQTPARAPSTTDSESGPSTSTGTSNSRVSEPLKNIDQKAPSRQPGQDTPSNFHSNDGGDLEIRKNNAYRGSFNTIGSIHQRRWFLSLDRVNSGFERTRYGDEDKISDRKRWIRKANGKKGLGGFEPFYVRGPDVERSVVTGRLGQDVLDDHAVQNFQHRKGWMPVLK